MGGKLPPQVCGCCSGEVWNWRGSLSGLVNVRPQDVALDAGDGFDALGEFNAGATDARKDLAQKRWCDVKLAGKRRLRKSVLANVK